jgi:acetate kinase
VEKKSLILVVNPGSSSRKYALFADGLKRADINFEFEDGKVTGKVSYDGQKYPAVYDDADLGEVCRYVLPLIRQYKIISDDENLTAIGIRVVAPVMRFTKDELITDEVESVLEAIKQKAPLHIATALAEIKQIKEHFPSISLIAISDTAFHSTKQEFAWYYGIDPEFAEKFGIKRYGYHGISIGSIVHYLSEQGKLASKTVICHLGSGSSLTAVVDGKSVDTTMGYSPLEGLMMATRSGTIDVSAALAIKRELNLSDNELEEYLNKKSGLLGVSGSSNDIRQLVASEEQGDDRARLALGLLVYRIQLAIGQMAASMGGVDSLVFTGTVGERSSIMRGRILDKLAYLGFTYSSDANDKAFEPSEPVNIGLPDSKPILVALTDEAAEIARRTAQYMQNQ